jgi:hypothetical protein
VSCRRTGDAEAVVGHVGRLRERDLARQAGPRLVGAQRVGDLDGVRGRRDAVEVELADLLDVLEDVRQLIGDLGDLLIGELQTRQPRHVQDLLAIDHGRIGV